MIRFAADENFNDFVVRGLRLRNPIVDIVRIQDAGLLGASDPRVLEWAAAESRILLTHDVATMVRFAYDRVTAGLRMPGVFEVGRQIPIRLAIDELQLAFVCSRPGEWENRVVYLPFP